jgi:hypothetical protein
MSCGGLSSAYDGWGACERLRTAAISSSVPYRRVCLGGVGVVPDLRLGSCGGVYCTWCSSRRIGVAAVGAISRRVRCSALRQRACDSTSGARPDG